MLTIRNGEKTFTLQNDVEEFHEKNQVWIENEGREGGAFSETELFEVIQKFFEERF